MRIFTKNHPASPEIIESLKANGEIIVEVTVKRFYILGNEPDLPRVMKDWFVTHSGGSHAYRDGSYISGADKIQQIRNLTTGEKIELEKDINWTPDMLARFKIEHAQAVKDKAPTFIFDDNEFVVDYAKYLIEYLSGIFK